MIKNTNGIKLNGYNAFGVNLMSGSGSISGVSLSKGFGNGRGGIELINRGGIDGGSGDGSGCGSGDGYGNGMSSVVRL